MINYKVSQIEVSNDLTITQTKTHVVFLRVLAEYIVFKENYRLKHFIAKYLFPKSRSCQQPILLPSQSLRQARTQSITVSNSNRVLNKAKMIF